MHDLFGEISLQKLERISRLVEIFGGLHVWKRWALKFAAILSVFKVGSDGGIIDHIDDWLFVVDAQVSN